MRFNRLIRSFAAAVALFACAAAASAQVTAISGKVTLKQADGTAAPVAGAQVDIYRTDIKQKFEVKTNKKGEYQHAGIPFVGTYTVVVSAPGASPTWQEKVRFTSVTTLNFTLEPGDGRRPSPDDIKAATAAAGRPAGGSSGGAGAAPKESKEEKAKREELERKVKEVEEGNKKIVESNEVIARTFKAGNEALNAGRLEDAITQYREGLATRPEEPALLTNLSEALRRRGVERFNAALKVSPADTAGMDAAKKDWTEAAAYSTKALEVIKTASATADQQQQQVYAQNRLAGLSTRAFAMKLVATKVDTSQAQAAWDAFQEYIAAESDATKKAKAKAEALQTIFDAGNTDLAVAQARAVIAEEPDNVDANRILGLALFASGDKAKFQEAANYLQRYVDKAPDTDPLKASARESLDYLKTAENVKPERVQPSRPAGRRRP